MMYDMVYIWNSYKLEITMESGVVKETVEISVGHLRENLADVLN